MILTQRQLYESRLARAALEKLKPVEIQIELADGTLTDAQELLGDVAPDWPYIGLTNSCLLDMIVDNNFQPLKWER